MNSWTDIYFELLQLSCTLALEESNKLEVRGPMSITNHVKRWNILFIPKSKWISSKAIVIYSNEKQFFKISSNKGVWSDMIFTRKEKKTWIKIFFLERHTQITFPLKGFPLHFWTLNTIFFPSYTKELWSSKFEGVENWWIDIMM